MGEQVSGVAFADWGRSVLSLSRKGTERRLGGLDLNFIRGSAVLSAGTAVARLLGFVFSLVLAGAFSPEDYGAIQYGITLSMIVAISTQPFGQHVLARFIGKCRDDRDRLRRVLASAWITMAALFGLTLLVAIPLLSAVGKFNVGILVVFLGVTLFYTYWGLCRGFLAAGKLTAVYLASNLVQLALVFLLVQVLRIRSRMLALVIYGASYLLPLAVSQAIWPFPIRLELSPARLDVVGELVRFSLPIWASHACFMLYTSMDVLMLERHSGAEAVGVYMVAKTLAMVFVFVPTGLSTLLMPRAAALPTEANRRLLKRTLAFSLAANGFILAAYLSLGDVFVRSAFGPEYVVDAGTSLILAMGMIAFGAHSIISAVLVAGGRAGVETISRVVAVCTAGLIGRLVIPSYGASGAAMAMSSGALGALVAYGAVGVAAMKRRT